MRHGLSGSAVAVLRSDCSVLDRARKGCATLPTLSACMTNDMIREEKTFDYSRKRQIPQTRYVSVAAALFAVIDEPASNVVGVNKCNADVVRKLN